MLARMALEHPDAFAHLHTHAAQGSQVEQVEASLQPYVQNKEIRYLLQSLDDRDAFLTLLRFSRLTASEAPKGVMPRM